MQTKLIHIGNSMGLRLPKSLIKQFSLDKGEIELSIEKDGIKIKSVIGFPAYEEWDALFSKAIVEEQKPERDIFDGLENIADDTDWTW